MENTVHRIQRKVFKPKNCLRLLFVIKLAFMSLTLLSLASTIFQFSLGGNWGLWAQRGLNLAMTLCLFVLPTFYRKAALSKAVWMAFNLLNTLALPEFLSGRLDGEIYMSVGQIISYLVTALAFIALFLEYQAHSKLCHSKDTNKWMILFVCNLVVYVGSLVASYVVSDLLNTMVQNGNTQILTVYNLAITAPSQIINIVYLVLLERTIRNVKRKENAHRI